MFPNDHTNTSDVMANSHASREQTTSDFDPDQEALVSTRQLDNGYRQPQSKRARRYDAPVDQESEPDFAIDTSALHKAFPDFSDASSSEEDDDISIEVGRGGKKPSRRLDDSRDSIMSIDDSRYSASPVAKGGRYGNPSPKPAVRSVSNRTSSGRDSLRKGAQIRRASLALKENNLPQELKNKSSNQRRTLSEMHAKATETYDGSYLSDERPAKVELTTRNTRFGKARTSDQGAKIVDAVNKAAGRTYLKHNNGDVDQAELHRQLAEKTTDGATDNLTHQSYALPDVPNLSDLVSGIYEDGTPKPKSRTTRFASPPAATNSRRTEHLPLDSIPVPDDEKAIFVSLKLLQEKVEALQIDKSDMEARLEEVEEENMILRSDNSRRQKLEKRRLSMYGGDDDINDGGVGKLTIQKSRLEAANLALQNRLDISARKISSQESTIKQMTQERDSARTQLGVAYLNLQELKLENDALAQENDELRIQLESETGIPQANGDGRHPHGRKSTSTEATKRHRSRVLQEVEEPDTNGGVDAGTRNTDRTHRDRSQPPRTSKENTSKQHKEEDYDALFSLDLSHLTAQQSTRNTKPRANTTEKKLPNTSKQRTRKAIVEYLDDSELSGGEMGTDTRGFRNRTGPTNDLTFLSFIDANEIAQLRKTLEEERVARKSRLNRDPTEQTKTGNSRLRASGDLNNGAPLKSSLKNTSSKVTRSANVELPELDTTDQKSIANNLTSHSTSTAGRRRQQSKLDQMTSAFILPDITMHGAPGKSGEPPKLSAAAQRVLNDVAQHDGKNCSVCKNVINGNSTHDHSNEEGQDSIKATKPVPVSDRMPEPSPYNDEPTLRPSQSPALALAKVLKQLEDELSHLKMQLAMHQTALSKHDASLGKKQRKSMLRKTGSLLREIDTKSDQIYALYDVLEGQKDDGHEMTQQEVDVTLQSIGLGHVAGKDRDLTERLGQDDTKGKGVARNGGNDSDSEYDEPPWEGFESTDDLTGRSFPRRGVKSS
ncbi:hypothetical protein AJ79_07056 [Helicocarpus griseus UAMH5409]|uniref:Cep57 centrosome microtubule-binding domain-containing protein n=1 Tax=Helicocarpus griseus UAMH5409 TaxID=1447875 RepID=A0A2B7X6N2_9EURO|nr:hypothetical protein AJ79_07056 [Helicocarpus griseus UAMH5409]